MLRTIVAAVLSCFFALSAAAAEPDLIVTASPHSVGRTLDKLSDALAAAGVKVVARVDHAAAAKSVGETLRPTELLVFGNPKLGTPLMQADQRAGIDLPMRALAWEDAGGKVFLAMTSPAALKARYGLAERDAALQAMGAAIDRLSAAATKPD